jgi:hypothetical protein
MIPEAITVWKMVVRAGTARIDRAGTPLILKLRNTPASRASTKGPGMPSRVLTMATKMIIAGIICSLKPGLIWTMIKPIMT